MLSKLPLAWVAVCVVAALGGCRTATVSQSVVATLSGNRAANQMDFWHTLAQRSVTDNDDAFHGLLLFLDHRDDALDYAARVHALKAKGILPRDFDRPSNQAVERGTIAYALVKALQFKGGINMRLFGVTTRWAIAELEFRGLFPPSGTNQTFTGGEFLGVISKVQDFRAGDPSTYPAQVLPGEIHGGVAVVEAPPEPQNLEWLDSLGSSELSLIQPVFASMMQDPNPSSAPSTRNAIPDGELIATVANFEGMVRYRASADTPWQDAKVGDKLKPHTKIMTGLGGALLLSMPPDINIAVDGSSMVVITQAEQKNGKPITVLDLAYGRVRHQTTIPGIEHESTIRTPNSTLSTRATIVTAYDQAPFPPLALSITGRAQYTIGNRRPVSVGSKNGRLAVMSSTADSPAQTAQNAAVVDPFLPAARTTAEEPLIASVISRGGVISFDQQANIRVVRGGGMPTNAELVSTLPGQLNFVVRWDHNSNVNLAVSTPTGDFLYPLGGYDRGKGGGTVPFDHRGGTGGGFEIVYFPPGKIAAGTYRLSAELISGLDSTVNIEAYLNRHRLIFDPRDPSNSGFNSTEPLSVGGEDNVIVSIPDPNDPTLEIATARAKRKHPTPVPAVPPAPAATIKRR